MADYSALLQHIPVDDIAKQLGVPESTAKSAVEAAIPAIIGGMAANAKDEKGARSLEGALQKHRGVSPKKTRVADIDTDDGRKIVRNVFGAKQGDVSNAVAKTGKGDVTKDLIDRVLPIIAPIVIAWVASKLTKKEPTENPGASGGGIGDLLGGLLGGDSGGGGDLLGGVLGGLLGGGRKG
ncbi:MAG TPA: DUF937 domain-containing protein [Rhodoglobus sp.]|nr:DUF937 domain-containing protein [Rhodoglobus sp.]